MKKVNFESIQKAHEVLKKILVPTPLIKNEWLSQLYECEVFLKLETAQPVGSFKIRGATYKISQLSEVDRKKGVIAASAGNHAQGVAWGARYFKTNAMIVMPETAPLTKVQNTQVLGASIHLEGENYDDAFEAAQRIIEKTGRMYVHAFYDADVIAGQGTIALEILDQCPDADFVVAPIGGGGLAAGIGLVLQKLSPETKLIACQAANCAFMVESIRAKKIVKASYEGTFADGIGVRDVRPEIYDILREVVSDTFESDEEEIAMNVLRLMETAKVVVEGGGAIVLGAMDRYLKQMRGKKVVLVLSGGNIDVNLISRIIDRGLIRSGRRLHVRTVISDRTGSLSKLTALIADLKGNILQAIHDRSESSVRLDETDVELMLETRGPDHTEILLKALEKHCKRVTVVR